MKHLQIITLLCAAAGVVKIIISLYFAISKLIVANLVGFYYVGEILCWGSLSVFMVAYYMKLTKKKKEKK